MSTLDFGPNKAGFVVNADSTGLGIGALTVDRKGTGSVIGFQNFGSLGGTLAPGSFSNTLFVETTATAFAFTGSTQFVDGGVAAVRTFAPVAAPEPASLILVGASFAGLGASCLLRPRRKRAAGKP
jgi:hypothetical protein